MLKRTALGLAIGLTAAAPLAAEEWSYRIEPYLWAPAFSADFRFGDDGGGAEDGGTSLIDVLEGALLLRGEARRGDFALFGEANYLRLGDQLDDVPAPLETELGLEGVMVALSGAWTVASTDRSRVELTAGARYWNVDFSADVQVLQNTLSARRSWVDPIVGGRYHAELGERIDLLAEGTVGGFDVGSELQTDVLAEIGWRFGKRWRAAAGYRDLRIEFSDSGLVADATISGPYVLVGLRF